MWLYSNLHSKVSNALSSALEQNREQVHFRKMKKETSLNDLTSLFHRLLIQSIITNRRSGRTMFFRIASVIEIRSRVLVRRSVLEDVSSGERDEDQAVRRVESAVIGMGEEM